MVDSSTTRVLVIGGGIGGLTAAIALRKRGIDAVAFERAPTLEQIQVGGGIHLWHNGMRGLQRIGLADEVEALGGRDAAVERAEFRTSGGSLLASWPVAEIEAEVGAPTVGVVRSELHRVLAEALGAEALVLGASCRGFEQHGDCVVARFDGHEERGAVLVGADGIRSTVRAQLHEQDGLRYAGYSSWQAFTDFPEDRAPAGLFRVYWGPGRRFLFYRVGPKRLYWEGIVSLPPGQGEGGKDAVLSHFRGWHDPIESILESTDNAAVFRSDIYDRPPTKTWGTGLVTLLGDAAHAMTNSMGQGANQTIEDAVVLARMLSEGPDHTASLRAYEQERATRSASFVRTSHFLSGLAQWRRPWACAIRNRWISFAFGGLVLKKVRGQMNYGF